MVDKELIGIWKNMLKPSISSWLLKTNYEGLGEQDKEEFERDFGEILDLALIGLNASGESKPMSDLIERQVAIDALADWEAIYTWDDWYNDHKNEVGKYHIIAPSAVVKDLPPAKPEITEEAVKEYCRKRCLCVVDGALLKKYASAQPELKWIPVSERLPEEHESMFARFYGSERWNRSMWLRQSDRVIVTSELADGTRITETARTRDGEWKPDHTILKREIVAWMPLPKPYKGETDETY